MRAEWVDVYLADGTLIVLADNSHLIDAAIAHWFVVAFADSDELGFFGAEDALNCHCC